MPTDSIIALCLATASFVLLAFLIYRTSSRAYEAGVTAGSEAAKADYERRLEAETKAAQEVQEELIRAESAIAQMRTAQRLAVAVTPHEIGLLVQAANMVELAQRTWKAMPGTQPVFNKASALLAKLEPLNSRLTIAATKAAQEEAA